MFVYGVLFAFSFFLGSVLVFSLFCGVEFTFSITMLSLFSSWKSTLVLDTFIVVRPFSALLLMAEAQVDFMAGLRGCLR
jgi:hypothetical protein